MIIWQFLFIVREATARPLLVGRNSSEQDELRLSADIRIHIQVGNKPKQHVNEYQVTTAGEEAQQFQVLAPWFPAGDRHRHCEDDWSWQLQIDFLSH